MSKKLSRIKLFYSGLIACQAQGRRFETVHPLQSVLSVFQQNHAYGGDAAKRADLRDNLGVMLGGGTETTAVALSWA